MIGAEISPNQYQNGRENDSIAFMEDQFLRISRISVFITLSVCFSYVSYTLFSFHLLHTICLYQFGNRKYSAIHRFYISWMVDKNASSKVSNLLKEEKNCRIGFF